MATFGTFVAGQVLTAAELNTAGVWNDYTPTWTQSATITKTTNWARYTQLNKLVIANLKMTASSAGTASNAIKVGLPIVASANNFYVGTAFFVSSGGATIPLVSVFDTSSTVVFLSSADTDSLTDYFGLSGFSPGGGRTLASGDVIHCQFMYEAA